MTSSIPLIDLSKSSQIHFATNLHNGSTRSSEYLNTNFDELKKVRELHVNDQDYDTSSGNVKVNLDDYYAGLRANEEYSDLKSGNIFIKSSFRENLQTFFLHCALLLVALICGSSVGVFYYYIQPGNQLLKASWRMLFLALCICPFTYFEYLKGKERFVYSKEILWSPIIWKKILLASLGHTIWTIALVIAVNHTSIAQANLLISIYPIMILIFKLFKGSNIVGLEIIGAVCTVIGVLLVLFDREIHSFGGEVDLNGTSFWSRNLLGNFVALAGSIGGALYYTKNQELKNEFPFFLGILIMTILGFFYISLLSIFIEGTSFSFDPNTGMFGFLTGKWIGVYLLAIIVTGFGTYIGYLVPFKYFESLLLLVMQHTEPIFATMLIVCLGWQSFPGVFTILAFVLIIPGVILVSLGNKEGEVREYDILNDSYSYAFQFTSYVNLDTKLVRTGSLNRHKSSLIGWEK